MVRMVQMIINLFFKLNYLNFNLGGLVNSLAMTVRKVISQKSGGGWHPLK